MNKLIKEIQKPDIMIPLIIFILIISYFVLKKFKIIGYESYANYITETPVMVDFRNKKNKGKYLTNQTITQAATRGAKKITTGFFSFLLG